MVEYRMVIRMEGRRAVIDAYDECGRLVWKGLSLAGAKDILEMGMEAVQDGEK